MNTRSFAKYLQYLVLIFSILVVISFCLYRYEYPFGVRPCCLPCTLESLREFASANNGKFPEGNSPQDALLKLYFGHFINADVLAGISGDRKVLKRELNSGSEISNSACSWVYWPGFRITDSPGIAIIWEKRAGLRFDGRRIAGGHAVGFIDGSNRVIPNGEWQQFLKQQEALRQKTLGNRAER